MNAQRLAAGAVALAFSAAAIGGVVALDSSTPKSRISVAVGSPLASPVPVYPTPTPEVTAAVEDLYITELPSTGTGTSR